MAEEEKKSEEKPSESGKETKKSLSPELDKFQSEERIGASIVPHVFMSRQDVAELGERLRMMVVGGQARYNGTEAMTLAQAALAHGLSPFNGEIWLLKQTDGTVIGLMIGVKGLRKHARRQARRMGTYFNIEYTRVIDPQLLEEVAPGAYYDSGRVVMQATLTIARDLRNWIDNFERMKAITGEYTSALGMLGPKPVIVTFGIYDPVNEKHYAKGKTKMSPVQIAKKRAEAAALKEAFDVPFGLEYDAKVDEVFDAEVSDYGEDELQEGPMMPEIGEEEEEFNATRVRMKKDEVSGGETKSVEHNLEQMGFRQTKKT